MHLFIFLIDNFYTYGDKLIVNFQLKDWLIKIT